MRKPFVPATLGQRIAHARRLLGVYEGQDLLAPELAERIGVSAGSVYGWEADEKTPREEALAKLAKALQVTPQFLRYGITEATPEPATVRRAKPVTVAEFIAQRDGPQKKKGQA